MDVLVSAIEPKQASQIVKELSALLPLDQAQVGSNALDLVCQSFENPITLVVRWQFKLQTFKT